MRNGSSRLLIVLACLWLAACATQPQAPNKQITEAQAVAALRTGEPLLRCREACLTQWRQAEPQASLFARYQQWRALAALVLSVGYQDDLTLYYLGEAAQGLGYPAAAASYYRQSLQLSGTTIACVNLSRQCGGVALPGEASLRLAALERTIRRPLPERRRPRGRREEPRPQPGELPLVPAEPEPIPPPMAAPPPPPPPAPPPPPPPPPPPAPNPAAAQFIEPPPAPH